MLLAIKQYVWYAVGIVFLCLCLALGSQTWRLHTAQRNVAQAELNYKLCQADTITLESSINKQNKDIQNASKESKAKEKDASKAAIKVLKKPLPPTGSGAEFMNKWLEAAQ